MYNNAREIMIKIQDDNYHRIYFRQTSARR